VSGLRQISDQLVVDYKNISLVHHTFSYIGYIILIVIISILERSYSYGTIADDYHVGNILIHQ